MRTEKEFIMLCYTISKLSNEQQTEFFSSIENICTTEQITALKAGAGYMHMYANPNYLKAVKKALGEQLYRDFTEQK